MALVPAPGLNGTPFSFGVEVRQKATENPPSYLSTIRAWFNGELVECAADGHDGGYGVQDDDSFAYVMLSTYNGVGVEIDQVQWFNEPGGTVLETEDCASRADWTDRTNGDTWTASGGKFTQPGGGASASTIARSQPVGARYMEAQGVVFTAGSAAGWVMVKLNTHDGLFTDTSYHPHGYAVHIDPDGGIYCFPGTEGSCPEVASTLPLRIRQRDDSAWRARLAHTSTARQDTSRVGRNSYW